MKAKVGEEGNVLGTLFALGELGKDEEAFEALAFAHTETLEADGNIVEITLGNVSSLHNAHGSELFKGKVDKRGNNAGGEDPFRDLKVNGGLDRGGPSVKGEEVDGREGIDTVDGDGDEEHKPQVDVSEGSAAAL